MTRKIKKLYYDIETTNFNADCGVILCISYKFSGDKGRAKVISLKKDFPNQYKKNILDDKLLLKKFKPILESADILIGHNAKSSAKWGFDLKYINHRLVVAHDMEPVLYIPEVDTYHDMAKHMKFRSCRLGQLAKMLGLSVRKEEMDFPRDWFNVLTKARGAMDKMESYSATDTDLLPLIENRLYKLARGYPNVGNMIRGKAAPKNKEYCPYCGNEAYLKDERVYSSGARNVYTRWYCPKLYSGCGLVFKGRTIKK